ncbi:IclR family transcriptional regulator [Arthrobacter sp. GMC3]|uniref:IclR family transcriptional regulator n=1 Tax=Arthrobacter sp. GMC3 TaxID=2058894 RepID=UPI000CE5555B|nr:IclR family transcriptional regulator [Arthrobacter sp. GMC3]
MANSTTGDSTLDRLVRVLSAFDAHAPSMSVGALASAAQLPVATTYRLVNQLIGHDFLRKDPSGNVRLGLGLWEVASRSSSAPDLREAAKPFMEDIQAVVAQHTQLAVLRDDEVLFIERLSSRESVVNQARIAGRLPAHRTSVGVVLLAFSPPHVQEAYFADHPQTLPPDGTGGGELRKVLAQARAQGYTALDGLIDEETTGIAVPVLGRGATAVAALGIVVPRQDGNVHTFLPVLMTGARGIARAMGSTPL